MSKRLALSCLCLTAFFALSTPAARAQGKWVDLPAFPEPHEEVIGQAANGKMYVFAGLVSAPVWLPVGIVYEYDPGANQWSKKQPMALPAHHLALAELNGKIYAFGGFTAGTVNNLAAWQPINNAFEYDPVKDSWKALAPMPTRRGAAVVVQVHRQIVLARQHGHRRELHARLALLAGLDALDADRVIAPVVVAAVHVGAVGAEETHAEDGLLDARSDAVGHPHGEGLPGAEDERRLPVRTEHFDPERLDLAAPPARIRVRLAAQREQPLVPARVRALQVLEQPR
jgi:hypothetical protein